MTNPLLAQWDENWGWRLQFPVHIVSAFYCVPHKYSLLFLPLLLPLTPPPSPFPSYLLSLPYSFTFPFLKIKLVGLGKRWKFTQRVWGGAPAEIEFDAFYMKNLASGENNLVTFMKNYIDSPFVSGKTLP